MANDVVVELPLGREVLLPLERGLDRFEGVEELLPVGSCALGVEGGLGSELMEGLKRRVDPHD
jgi:hypothetical protein